MSKSKKSKKELKKEHVEKMMNYEPIFKLQLSQEDLIMCKYVGQIESREKLYDEPVELSEKGGVLMLDSIDSYEILGRASHCIIPGGFLLKNKKLPVCYISVMYASNLVTGGLFNYFLYFTIDPEYAKELVLPRQYVNKMLKGKFTIEVMDAEGFMTWFIKKKRPEIEKKVMIQFVDKFETATDEEKELIESQINKEVEKNLDEYRNILEPIQIDGFFSRKKIFEKMEKMLKTEKFKEMTKACLDFTQKQRVEKMGATNLKVPKKVLKIEECINNPDKIDEYVNNITDSSDESDNSDSDEIYEDN